MSTQMSLEATLGELLFNLSSAEVRKAAEEEVDVLLRRYPRPHMSVDLEAIALTLGAPRDLPPRARLRLRLWATVLRRRSQAQVAEAASSSASADEVPERPWCGFEGEGETLRPHGSLGEDQRA